MNKEMIKAACSGCGQAIYWIKTEAGKNMPVDTSRCVVVTPEGKTVSGHISHFATCPKAAGFRRGK
jgi:hypothetical protein